MQKGETIPGIPFLKVVDLQEKKKTINDTEYDVSELILENSRSRERYVLTKKNPSREYKKTPIELVESVQFSYQLAGAPAETFTLERGKDLNLASLDKNHTETYKLVNISKDGVLLEKDGRQFTVKPSAQSRQEGANTTPPQPPNPIKPPSSSPSTLP
jgi:hypothetical protein